MKEYKLKINGNSYQVCVEGVSGAEASVTVNGKSYTVGIDRGEKSVVSAPSVSSVPSVAPVIAPKPASMGSGAVKSPLPGTILDIKVSVGDSVKVGQRLLVLEAMKMENNVDSDREGVVKEIKVSAGMSVLEGEELMIIG